MLYFDTSATTPLLPEVRDRMLELMGLSVKNKLGNASSLHTTGSRAKFLLNEARSQVAQLIGVPPLELIFTSSGSESNNTVVHTFENCPIFISSIEHPSVLKPAETYSSPCIKIPVNKQGIIDLDFLETTLQKTARKNPKQKILVSVQLANNEVGTIEPIKEIAKLIKRIKQETKTKIYLHTDATQAVGKIPVNAKDLGVDYLTFTAHKLGGPVGIAALYARTGAPFRSLIMGGAQENKKRAGTSNVILASGFGTACELAKKNIKEYRKIKALKEYLLSKIKEKIKTSLIITPDISLPNILNASFKGAEGESVQLYLDLEGFEVSTGSACASGDLEPSHVLMAMYHDPEIAHGSIRFSLPLGTTKQDIDQLMQKLPEIVKKVQDLSTLNKENLNA